MAILGGWRITRTGIVFVLGTVLLIGLVFGGIWLVRDRGEQARRQEAIKVAEQNLAAQSQANSEESLAPAATETASSRTPSTTNTTSATAAELPATGAEAFSIVAVALLTLSAGYYVTSRRAVSEL